MSEIPRPVAQSGQTTRQRHLGARPVRTGWAVINNVGTNIPLISADIGATPIDIRVGDGPGNTSRVDHASGTAGCSAWCLIGRNGATGVYNLADTATPGGGISGFAQGFGSLNIPGGRHYVGGQNVAGGGR